MRILLFLCIFLLTCNTVRANDPSQQKLVIANPKEGVYVYATPNEKEGKYTDFRVLIGKELVETFGWKSDMRETRQPELHVVDLNQDGEKEVVVIFTLGTGTFVVQKEAHILQRVETWYGKAYEEMDIDHPVHTIERDFKITATEKIIRVRGRGELWQTANPCGKTDFHRRFPLYQSVNWKVEGHQLIADIGLTITSNCVPAGFLLTYKQKGEIYVAQNVEVNLE